MARQLLVLHYYHLVKSIDVVSRPWEIPKFIVMSASVCKVLTLSGYIRQDSDDAKRSGQELRKDTDRKYLT